MQSHFPNAHEYLKRFERELRDRAAFRRYFRETDPFWSMFNVSEFTFASWKVVWREQASGLTCAVVGPSEGKPVVPDHKLMMIETASDQEAFYLCGILNSQPARLAVSLYAVEISMDTHILENIAVPKFSSKQPTHRRLAELSQAAQRAASLGDDEAVHKAEHDIDIHAAKVWGLNEEEVKEIAVSLKELSL